MFIREESLKHWIDHFYGYGSWDARFWFVGHEEGGGDLPEEVAAKLEYFDSVHPGNNFELCNIRELYQQVTNPEDTGKHINLYEHRFGKNAALHGGWRNLIGFAHGYQNKKLPDLLKYQRTSFVSTNEAMVQLYPLPSPHNHAWYYSWVVIPGLSFIRRRDQYEAHLYPARIGHILQMIMTHKPEVVLMYGMSNINKIKESVSQFFPAAKFKLVNAIKMKIPQHHQANVDGTKLLITTQVPTLRHNRIETGFDWYAFGKSVRK
jgi:hypothetical protein